MPHWLDQLFIDCGQNPRDYFHSKPLETVCKYFWEDGTKLSAPQGIEGLSKALSLALNEPQNSIIKYLKNSSYIYRNTSHVFLEKSLHSISTYLDFKIIQSIFSLPFLGIFSTMNRNHERRFSNEKTVQYFNRYATYNGSNPYEAPSTLGVIPHIENFFGAHAPKDGMYSITKSIQKLAIDLGVIFHMDKRVERIEIENKRAIKIHVEKENIAIDYLVCNGDVNSIYPLISDPKLTTPKPKEPSSSAVIFYWGINKQFAQLDVHNIFFSADYKKEFDTIFNKRMIDEDPTVYINISSKYAPQDAPSGKENWFVMVNAPYNKNQDWAYIKKQTKKAILGKLNRMLKCDISKLIEEEKIWTPKDIEKETSSYLGALYGNSSNSKTAAFFRHRNKSSIYRNIYFCGGSVHPGGGIPLCLQSAKITSELLFRAE